MNSPNILMIVADQMAPQTTGTYGHPIVKTPAMDRLAERGCRFDSAYTPSPICAPARSSFVTGQLPTRIKTYDNASEFCSTIPTFAHYLKLMGYRTSLAGKMHFIGPDQLHGFDERLTTDIYPADYAWTPNWLEAEERIDKWYHNMNSVKEAGTAATTFQIEFDEEVGFRALRRIYDYAREPGQPFMMLVSFIHPHDPYVALPQWWNLYDNDKIDMPEVTSDDVEIDPHSQRLRLDIQVESDPPTIEQIRNARHAYYANTSYVDHWVEQLVETLTNAGLLDNTVVIMTADHGEMLGERGLWYKMNFFENSARVPLIIAGPDIVQRQVEQPCCLVDLLPTMLDLASVNGNSIPDLATPVDGTSLTSLLHGSDKEEGYAASEYCAEGTTYPMFMVRQGSYKYIHCDSDPPMLFDLASDPKELNNLAKDSSYTNVMENFAKQVQENWNSAMLREDIISSQTTRILVNEAMQRKPLTSWEFQPPGNAANEYVRNHLDWTVVAARKRFPVVAS